MSREFKWIVGMPGSHSRALRFCFAAFHAGSDFQERLSRALPPSRPVVRPNKGENPDTADMFWSVVVRREGREWPLSQTKSDLAVEPPFVSSR